ncbi:conserved Plasmodium protein, unknown function [Plasmodium relictum]|uniref:Uncharacterized protein n=1 Tax=Plasmodium relictum TaxID=85471 RepID=A0A1J1H1T3_PLARL|nr:conserved Plasmodium protein, unknown function [Plasmodium relictum]CRG98718.1 conserved Plasmodium protein, unknown function [Plasmodium relictum]
MNIFKNNFKKFSYLNQKRFLGNTVRGPLPKEISKNAEYALDFFTKRAHTYQDFKQQCESLRIFIYFGLVTFFSFDFLINPLKSSYWSKFTPINLFKCFFNYFSVKQDDIFRHNGCSSYEKYIQLIN